MRSIAVVLFAAGLAGLPCLAADPAPTIAVDVGHSSSAPGALSARGRPEFGFNLTLAGEIASALGSRGYRTVLIGAEGTTLRLSERTARARGADLLLSIHHDSVQPHYLLTWDHDGTIGRYSDRYAGFSLFVSRRNAVPGRSLRCASAIGHSLRKSGFRPSLYHAERIAGESKPFADRDNGVHFFDNLVVLKTASSPAVLLEAGVIVNREEELSVSEDAVRRRMAEGVAEAVARCLPAGAPQGRRF